DARTSSLYEEFDESGESDSEYQPDKSQGSDQPSSPLHGDEEQMNEEDSRDEGEDVRKAAVRSRKRQRTGAPAPPRWNWWALPMYQDEMLESYDDFRNTNGQARKDVLATIARRLRQCAEENSTPLSSQDRLEEKIKNWFGNYRGGRYNTHTTRKNGNQDVQPPTQPKNRNNLHEDGGKIMGMRCAVPILFSEGIELVIDELISKDTKGKQRTVDESSTSGDGVEEVSKPRVAYTQDAISIFIERMTEEDLEVAEDFIED
ncbi:hypothetical protein BDY19DRAFT_999009, partial [Irpex rosettiformis]